MLDIEGTTSSISFVHDVMFPYVRNHLHDYLNQHWKDLSSVLDQMARDAGAGDWAQWCERHGKDPSSHQDAQNFINSLMDADSKTTGLKSLQGLIWESGFHSGALVSDVYPDVLPAIKAWRAQGLDVRIYSSGSIAAQRLFFGHVAEHGNCLNLFSGHYDTTIGNKREAESYRRIAADWNLPAESILFVSDLAGELSAAVEAGVQVAASVRTGNAPLPPEAPWPRITSFADIELI